MSERQFISAEAIDRLAADIVQTVLDTDDNDEAEMLSTVRARIEEEIVPRDLEVFALRPVYYSAIAVAFHRKTVFASPTALGNAVAILSEHVDIARARMNRVVDGCEWRAILIGGPGAGDVVPVTPSDMTLDVVPVALYGERGEIFVIPYRRVSIDREKRLLSLQFLGDIEAEATEAP